jgi:uncharacterized protein YbjQ (UPF0145 family)
MSNGNVHISNTQSIPGEKIDEHVGLVMGNTVRARNVGQDLAASVKNISGGEINQYSDLLTEARNEALDRLESTARNAGADAVVNLRFQVTEVTDGVTEVLAYGTAVRIA